MCNAPLIEEPLERNVEMLDGGIGIDEDDEAV
jgi:hypothetical protein